MERIETGCTVWYDKSEESIRTEWHFDPVYQGVLQARLSLIERFGEVPEADYIILLQDDEPFIHELVWNPAKYRLCPECLERSDWTCMCEDD